MRVTNINQLLDHGSRHQAERSPCKFQSVHVDTHRFEHIFEVVSPHWRVIGASDFGYAPLARFGWAIVDPEKWERPALILCGPHRHACLLSFPKNSGPSAGEWLGLREKTGQVRYANRIQPGHSLHDLPSQHRRSVRLAQAFKLF